LADLFPAVFITWLQDLYLLCSSMSPLNTQTAWVYLCIYLNIFTYIFIILFFI
jgi:hypothetical protein